MSISSKSQARKIDAMSPEERLAYLVTGRVVAVRLEVVDEQTRKTKAVYAARIRGVIVGNKKKWKFETPEAAREHGLSYQAYWRKELAAAHAGERREEKR